MIGPVRTFVGPRSGLCWHNVYDDPAGWAREHPSAAALPHWIHRRLTHPHPELGRIGPVCPFARPLERRHGLWAAVLPGEGTDTRQLAAAVDDATEGYLRLHAGTGDSVSAWVTVLPDLSDGAPVDAVHAARKSAVVARGLMLGQFYPGCAVPGLWNRDFHPLDAPLPMLVVRAMMNTDFPFLVARTEWLYAYLTRVAPALPRRLRRQIAEQLRRDGDAAAAITELRVHAADETAR